MYECDNIVSLARIDLGTTSLRRDHIIPPRYMDEVNAAKYDRTTLWYDAFYSDRRVTLIAPPLLNLASHLLAAEVFLDNEPVIIKRKMKSKYYEILQIDTRCQPNEIKVKIDGKDLSARINEVDRETFRGKNVIMVKSKDNDLTWIRDFSAFHKETQGAQAVLFFDNGSKNYSPDDILETLQSVGVDAIVVNAPVAFGPHLKNAPAKYIHRAQFFQHAALNIGRLRFLSAARAVLCIDIDELVWSEKVSVFDRAVENPFGYCSFRGYWRNPSPDLCHPLRHADHLWGNHRHTPTGRLAPAFKKYAVAPGKISGKLSWSVHRVSRFPIEGLFERRDCGFWHCSGISTGWRYRERLERSGGMFIDTHMKDLLGRTSLKGSSSEDQLDTPE